jgi:tetratricopeptide (TPR) repeat protein
MRMKISTIINTILFVNLLVSISVAQNSNQIINQAQETNIGKEYLIKESVYRTSLRYGDLVVAKQALFEMLSLKPNDKALKDTLAYLYLNMGAMRQSLLISKEILADNPTNFNILEVKAISEHSLGLIKEALNSYEYVYLNSKNVFHLYQIATLQFELKRMGECNLTIQELLNSSDIEKREISIATGEKNRQQNINLKSAVLNIKGVMLLELNDFTNAKTFFEDAIKISPNFVLANNNLAFVNSKIIPKVNPLKIIK